MKQKSLYTATIATLASLKLTVVCLFLLLILTVWGTLYQVENGLYLAQERFYQSNIFFIAGFIPFPGAQLVMAVLFVNLVASVLLLAQRRKLNWPFMITHLGLILMLAGGAITVFTGKDAQLTLDEGDGSNVAIAFGEWELSVMPMARDNAAPVVHALDARKLRPGRTINLPGGQLAIRVEEYHRNCMAVKDAVANPPINSGHHTALNPLPGNKERGADMPGVIFTLLEDGKESGRYLLWGRDPNPTALQTGPGMWLGLRRMRVPLPATIQLVDFRRELYPGSPIAKSYESQVIVDAGDDLERNVLISMNKPLRLGNFTFYQSSFSSTPGGRESSTFSVVKNSARTLPYIATGATAFGMMLHFIIVLIRRLKRKPVAEAAT